MSYAIDFPATTTLPVAESNQAFPVGRIYCVEGHVDGVGDLQITYAKGE